MDHVSFTHKPVYGFLLVPDDSMLATQSPKRKVGTMCSGLKAGYFKQGLKERKRVSSDSCLYYLTGKLPLKWKKEK